MLTASLISVVLIGFTLLLTAEFVIAYHVKSGGAWRLSRGGKAIMLLMSALAVVLLAAVLGLVETAVLDRPRSPAVSWLRLLGFAAVPVAVFRLRLLLRQTLPGTPPASDTGTTQPHETGE